MEHKTPFGIRLFLLMAVLLVLLANALYLFQFRVPFLSQFAPLAGFFGIESLLVLGGYGLYRSFKPVYLAENFGARSALGFVGKMLRWFLPVYLIAVLANAVLAFVMDYAVPSLWQYLLLLQNAAAPIPAFFPESWPVPILFFALLLYPVLMLVFDIITAGNQKHAAAPVVSALVVFIFLWTKWLFNATHEDLDLTDWDTRIKTVALYRLDSVFYGIVAAWLLDFSKVMRLRWFWAVLGLCGLLFFSVGVGFLRIDIAQHAFFWNVLYLPLASVVLALFLPLLHHWKNASGILAGAVSTLSPATFSIYLVHFSLVLLLLEQYVMGDLPSAGPATLSAWAALYFVCAIAIGTALHFGVEKPIRKRLKP